MDETIVAVASAPGASGVGIVRLDGPAAKVIASALVDFEPGGAAGSVCGVLDRSGSDRGGMDRAGSDRGGMDRAGTGSSVAGWALSDPAGTDRGGVGSSAAKRALSEPAGAEHVEAGSSSAERVLPGQVGSGSGRSDVSGSGAAGSVRVVGEVRSESGGPWPCVLYVFSAPHSYTRHDAVEIHAPGSPVLLRGLVARAVEAGAREAEPGEFTARAFLNGAMDLTQAEAVAALISATDDRQLRAARRMASNVLAGRIREVVEPLAALLARVEADIDFAEEPIEFITPAELALQLGGVDDALASLVRESAGGERFDEAPHVMLLGPPNAGKSTLLNALSGTGRAICSNLPGTTRDVLTVRVRMGRGEVVLLDAAGVDPADVGPQAQARCAALAAARSVDLVCVVVDGSVGVEAALVEAVRSLAGVEILIAVNKSDLLDAEGMGRLSEAVGAMGFGRGVFVSARCGTGLASLREGIRSRVWQGGETVGRRGVVLTARHRLAIDSARVAVGRAVGVTRGARRVGDQADVLAFELREALDALGTVTGAVTTEDLLTRIFSSFCIGK